MENNKNVFVSDNDESDVISSSKQIRKEIVDCIADEIIVDNLNVFTELAK